MLRFGSAIRLRTGALDQYRTFHADVWPEVLAAIEKANIRNYSIYHRDGFLFSYYEYHGENHDGDMAAMAANPDVQRWWAIMDNLQEPLPTREPGEWWVGMEEVFHCD